RYADRGGHLLIALDPDANTSQITAPSATANGAASAPPASSAAPAGSADAKAKSSAEKAPPNEEKKETAEAPVPAGIEGLAGLAQLTYSPTLLANDRAHVRLSFNDADRARMVTNSFSSHASVSTLSRNAPAAAIVVFGAGSLDRATGATAKIDFAVRAPTGTFADKNKNYTQDKDSEKSGSFNLAAAVTKPIVGGAKPAPAPDPKDKKPKEKKPETKEMRAFVMSDADAFSDLVMSNVRGNQVLLLDAVRWLVGEESFAGAETSEEDVHVEQTKQQDLTWFYTTIFGVPCLVLGAGVVISRRSRRVGGAKR
ncbi:MAG TPA: hypothetical protein VGM44_07770, partial [Polyangiaceae bacterium]